MDAYDTLDQFDTAGVATIAEVYELLLGKAMASPEICGILTTGPLTQSQTHVGNWGSVQLSFRKHPEVWRIRCYPPGRMGMPLEREEVRMVSVLVRASRNSPHATVTNIKLWLRPPTENVEAAMQDTRQNNRGRLTAGPMGVAVHGINIFANRATAATKFTSARGSQTVLSAIATITPKPGVGPISRIESSRSTHFAIARSLAGVPVADMPTPTRCDEGYTEDGWKGICAGDAFALRQLCHQDPRLTSDADTYLKLLFTSEDVCEQMSFIGLLDQRADPFFEGALQDDMHKPSGFPLMLAIAVRVACNPERYGLEPSTADDAFATRDASLFLESVMPGMTLGPLHGATDYDQVYSFDAVISYALDKIRETVLKLQSGELDGKRDNLDFKKVDRATKETLHFFMCTGTAVCINLFGVRPNLKYEDPGPYTDYGIASYLLDPVTESRAQCAYSKGLGNVLVRWPTLRTSTRGRRQLALASMLIDVDRWLRYGRYRGVVLKPTNQASFSVHPRDLDVAGKAAAQTSAPAPAARSAKKKKKPESLLAERGKLRDRGQQQCAAEAARSLLKSTNKSETLAAAASTELNGDALAAASGIFGDVLQQGACMGMTDLYDVTTYLIGPTSKVLCAHCNESVNVVQSVAFAGSLGACHVCEHPRCLACVSSDIDLTASGLPRGEPLTCRACQAPWDGPASAKEQ